MSNFNDKLFNDLFYIEEYSCEEILEKYTGYKCSDMSDCRKCKKIIKEYLLDKTKNKFIDWAKVPAGTKIKVKNHYYTTTRTFVIYYDGFCWITDSKFAPSDSEIILYKLDPDCCFLQAESEE